MALSRLPRVGQTIDNHQNHDHQHKQPPVKEQETGVKANTAEGMRLYKRGVAAARGGQRRIAAGLLTRSVQLDPNNEGAWLWLSGVIDDPHQIAFCLHSVLKLNPANERARKGLKWLEERQLLNGAPAKPAPFLGIDVGETKQQRKSREEGESWWVSWREARKDLRRASLMWWSVPLILVTLALILHQSFTMALEQAKSPPEIPTPQVAPTSQAAAKPVSLIAPTPPPSSGPTTVPMLSSEPIAIRESKAIAYMNQLNPIRQTLRDEVEAYRNVTGKPGSAAVGHTAAAQQLREAVEDALNAMQVMDPPQELQEAHETYIKGLELELEAIDAMSEFYSSYKTELANRAAVRFQEANSHFERARATFRSYMQQVQRSSAVPVHTVR